MFYLRTAPATATRVRHGPVSTEPDTGAQTDVTRRTGEGNRTPEVEEAIDIRCHKFLHL